ncbi:TetR/AcrR family transcriptional regulator [Methanosarcina sp. 1.H.A.2.2]|jgi:AcrR family transcriptional regulator|uniref:TetR/AcrR family transcriptional regulator n=1 Tax=Methanosarcina sp. 1.H.A.2.2 TaxID=1483601 RepID=UPI00062267BC|nr:TetR/AcrR family transcriptional regulator [Methanosarcina sp. 1.H.A.2.2]KKH45658.1 TetR family transcriptional regulator [Methanosarcina sp. 1.H.A.2.2]
MDQQVKDKKTAIMDVALKLFTERGFHGTSTAQISKDAGVATGTLFNYFPTKEDLINSLYFEVKGRLSRSIKAGIDEEVSIRDKLRRLWSNFIMWGVNNPEEYLFVEQFCSSPYITKITREEVMKEYIFLSELVQEGVTSGVLKDYTPELTMKVFFHGTKAVVSLILDSNVSLDTEELIENGFRIIWNGLTDE